MIGFLIKKAFFDAWDHLFTLVFLNLGCLASATLALLAFLGSRGESIPLLVLSAFLLLVFFVWMGTEAFFLKMIADFHSPRFSDIPNAFKSGWLPGLQYGISLTAMLLLILFALPFYLSMQNFLGIFAAALVFWCIFTVLLAFQYFLPVRTMLKGGYLKAVKKCFLISFDNAGFSFFLLFWTMILAVVSLFSAFMIPGVAGMQLAALDALKLRLYKYDWLEGNPDANRKKIPWASLLEEDNEALGKRSFKSMIFPWKD